MAVNRLPLSVCLLTKNEAEVIEETLSKVDFADEILILDTGSTDSTVDIARSLGAVVTEGTLESFADARNQLLDQARNDWVLFLDADEHVTPELAQSIRGFLEQSADYVGGRIHFGNVFMGRQLKHGDGVGWILRLGRKSAGRWKGAVHEVWELEGSVKELDGWLTHYSHADYQEYISKTDFYTDKEATSYQGKKGSLIAIATYPIAKFIKVYFFQLGILDGYPGLVYAWLNSRYSYIKRKKIFLQSRRSSN